MRPLLDSLSPLITFHIKSQWLYSVRLEGYPRQVQEESKTWYSLSEDVLPHIITPLEKKLGMNIYCNFYNLPFCILFLTVIALVQDLE